MFIAHFYTGRFYGDALDPLAAGTPKGKLEVALKIAFSWLDDRMRNFQEPSQKGDTPTLTVAVALLSSAEACGGSG